MDPRELGELLRSTVIDAVGSSGTETSYRPPIVGFAGAADERFPDLKRHVGDQHMLPEDLLPGAKAVISFFIPFSAEVVEANRVRRGRVAREWAVAYVETNALIAAVCERLTDVLRRNGYQSAAAPATGNFDRDTLESGWSHKSVAVIAGVGRFGLHNMVITESGCAGRFGSLVTDAPLEATQRRLRELCLQFGGGTCKDCVDRCPVGALNGAGRLDRQMCWTRCLAVATRLSDLEAAEVCGKCAVGRCALEVPKRGERAGKV